MNLIEAIIVEISAADSIHSVTLQAEHLTFEVLTLSLASSFSLAKKVNLMFKETEVSLLLESTGKVSIANVLDAKILKIVEGTVLSEVFLDLGNAVICSIVSTKAVKYLDLTVGAPVKAMIKASDISMEVL